MLFDPTALFQRIPWCILAAHFLLSANFYIVLSFFLFYSEIYLTMFMRNRDAGIPIIALSAPNGK